MDDLDNDFCNDDVRSSGKKKSQKVSHGVTASRAIGEEAAAFLAERHQRNSNAVNCHHHLISSCIY
jgi:hypothetical protein